MFRNSRNQMPCQVPVASFPFDIGMLTLAPIKDDLICAYHITGSAICPWAMNPGLNLPACHHCPLHRACTTLFRLRNSSAWTQERLHCHHLKLSFCLPIQVPTYLYLLSLSYPMHHSYLPAHRRPSSRSLTVHSSCAAGTGVAVRILCRISGGVRK